MDADFIILAAGAGSRTKADLPKMFQEVAGKPLIRYVIEACQAAHSTQIVTVVSKTTDGHRLFEGTRCVVQETPKGTGDAVACAMPLVRADNIVIVCADTPLIEAQHLQSLMAVEAEAAFIAMHVPPELSHMQYGRVAVGENCDFQRIVEHKDIGHNAASDLANSGIYKFRTQLLLDNLSKLRPNGITGELYLTDILQILQDQRIAVLPVVFDEYWPFHGINSMEDLAAAEAVMQSRLRRKFMSEGTRLLAPGTVYLSHDTCIGRNVVIEPHVVLGNGVKLCDNSTVLAFSHLEDCEVGENATIGPFAKICGGTVLGTGTVIGNFVEIKRSSIGDGAKAKHLAYIGDAAIGANANIGAGVITCNFDGAKKHKTVVAENAFVGANAALIAPVRVGAGSLVAAGSVITDDVPDGTLGIARGKQENKKLGS